MKLEYKDVISLGQSMNTKVLQASESIILKSRLKTRTGYGSGGRLLAERTQSPGFNAQHSIKQAREHIPANPALRSQWQGAKKVKVKKQNSPRQSSVISWVWGQPRIRETWFQKQKQNLKRNKQQQQYPKAKWIKKANSNCSNRWHYCRKREKATREDHMREQPWKGHLFCVPGSVT